MLTKILLVIGLKILEFGVLLGVSYLFLKLLEYVDYHRNILASIFRVISGVIIGSLLLFLLFAIIEGNWEIAGIILRY